MPEGRESDVGGDGGGGAGEEDIAVFVGWCGVVWSWQGVSE